MTVSLQRFILILLCAIPIVGFYWSVLAMSVNVPFQDDFDALLEPVLFLHNNATSFAEFWQVLFTQDDERRIVVDRLIAYGLFKTTGELNLRTMMIAGALNLLVFAGVLYQWFRSTRTPWLLFLPIPWLLFNVQFYETVFWAMIPFQHLAVFIWAILTIWLVSRDSELTLALAILSAIFTIFSDVSGNFVIIPGLLVLITQRRWKAAAVWAIIVGALVAYYFTGLEVPEYRPKFSDNFGNPGLLISVWVTLFGVWADPGPGFPVLIRQSVAIVFGISCLVFAGYTLVSVIRQFISGQKLPEKNQLFIWGSLCFIAIILTILATGRASEGLFSIFKPRYRHMYVFWAIFIYLLSVTYFPDWFRYKATRIGVIAVAVLFGVNAYVAYWGGLDQYRKTFLTDGYQWYHNRSLPSSPIYLALRKRVDEIYEGVYKQGIYRAEHYPFADLPGAPVKGETGIEMTNLHGAVEVEVKDFVRKTGKDDGAYVIFKGSEGDTHIIPAYNTQRPLHRYLLEGSYYYPGARTERYVTEFFGSATYDVEIGVIEGASRYRLLTGKQLRL